MNAEIQWFLERGSSLEERIVAWRRDFHRHPELAFQEERTAARVAEELDSLGFEVTEGIGGTGVAARIRGDREGPARGLRADMDALPIQEETGLPYGSVREGVMHACCHDGHVAMLLGVAAILAARKHDLAGEVVLVFQPAEEGFAGAKKMLDDGLLERFPMEFLFGHHIMPVVLPHRSIVTRKGVFTANSDRFFVEIHGKGGHASMPHLVKDPVPALGQMIGAVNTVVSRDMDPFGQAVVSIGQVHAGTCENIIPDRAALSGSVRTFTDEARQMIRARLEQICSGTGQAHGLETAFEYRCNYQSVLNDSGLTARVLDLGRGFPGRVIEKETPFTGSEDFSFFSREIPSCFIMLGADGTAGVHHPAMTFDESVLAWGSAWQAYLAFSSGFFPKQGTSGAAIGSPCCESQGEGRVYGDSETKEDC